MVARLKSLCRTVFCHHCADRNAACKALCKCRSIRLYAKCLICKKFACSAHAALNLVKKKEHIVFVTKLSNLFKIFLVGRYNSAFALNRLKKNRTSIFINCHFKSFKVVERNVLNSRKHWVKTFMIFVLSCCRNCTVCSAVERFFHSNYISAFFAFHCGIFSCKFKHRLYRLGTTVAEENFVKAAVFAKFFGKSNLWLCIVKV